MPNVRIDQLRAHPRSKTSPLALSTTDLVVRDSALGSSNTRKTTLQAVRGANILAADDFGGDLTAALSAADAGSPCLLLFGSGTYTWPDGVELPLGVSILGTGGGGSIDGTTGGTRISSTGAVVQTTGPEQGTFIQNVCFEDGLAIKKQFTTVIGCMIAGAGLTVGHATSSPYYCAFLNCIFAPSIGGTCITCTNFCNANTWWGCDLQIPEKGRGVLFTGGCDGNHLSLAVDYTQTGDPMSGDIGAVFYFDNAQNNVVDVFYWENRLPHEFRDGAHIIFTGANANHNRVSIAHYPADLRVWHKTLDCDNVVQTARGSIPQYHNGNFNWDAFYSSHVNTGAATAIEMPPTTLRHEALTIMPSASGCTLYPPSVVSAVGINAAGFGGTNGTYYQSYSDGNVVTSHTATVKITVLDGAIAAVELLYPGWFTADGAATMAVTAVPGLSGGVVALTWTAYHFNFSQSSLTLTQNTVNILYPVGSDQYTWYHGK